MNRQSVVAVLFAVLATFATATVDHDKLQPIPQPQPVTVSEKAAVLCKPQLRVSAITCVPFPAVSAAGEITGGLKGTNGNDAFTSAPKGSQVYGRAGWYRDRWSIMYAWYFPKDFNWMGLPSGRHDWRNVVVWIDNPAVESPNIVAVSMSASDSSSKYYKELKIWASYFAGSRITGPRHHRSYIDGSKTSLRFEYRQLPEVAREALNNNDNFGSADVPFNDANYEKNLEKAWNSKPRLG